MPNSLISVLVVIALVVVAGVAIWLGATRERRARLRERVNFDLVLGGPRVKEGFVGRTYEITAFTGILTKWGKRSTDAPRLVVVTGDAGIGKRALLDQFRELSRTSRNARVGPLFELERDTGGPEKVMRVLAAGLEDVERNSAAQFHARLQRLDDQRYERASPLQSAVQAAQGTAATLEQLGVPGAKAVAVGTRSGLVAQAVTQLDLPIDIDELQQALVADLRELAKRAPNAPLVLFFADLDARPGDRGAEWLRDTLLGRLGDVPVLVIVSAQSRATAELLERQFEPVRRFPLRPLDDEDRRRYAREVIGLKESGAIEQIVERSKPGAPGRLEAIRQQIESDPELLSVERLPDWVFTEAGADVTRRLLEDAEHPLDGRVLQAGALLRWFNASLLEDVAAAAGVQSKKPPLDVPAIIERARTAPPKVRAVDRGWMLSDDRRAIADELRRLSPDIWRAVQVAAAQHHHRRLESGREAPALEDMLAWRPPDDLTDRVRERDWLDALLERQYHLLALRPQAAASSLCDIAATMLYLELDDAAWQLLDVEVDPEELGRNRVYVTLMRRAAWALRDGRAADAATTLSELASCNGPTPIVTAATRYRLGLLNQLTGDYDGAQSHLEFALNALSDGALPVQRRLTGLTTAWLGWVEAARGGAHETTLLRLDDASRTIEPLGDLDLATWIEHIRARAQDSFGSPEDARAGYGNVLTAYEQLADPKGIASVRLSRALVLDRLSDADAADEDIDIADSIVQELDETTLRADVELVRTLLALNRRDLETAQRHCGMAIMLRPNDHSLIDQLGRCFYGAEFYEEARALHERAIGMATGTEGARDEGAEQPADNDVAVYHADLAYAHLALEDNDAAAKEFARAAELEVDNPRPLRALLPLQHDEEATATAERLSSVVQRRAAARTRQTEIRLLPSDLLDALNEAMPYLDADEQTAALDRLIDLLPKDPRLRYELFSRLRTEPPVETPHAAREALRQAVELLTDDEPRQMRHDYLMDHAELLVGEHEWDEARDALRRAAETGLTSARWSKISLRAERLERWDKASFTGPYEVAPRICVDVSDDLTPWFNPVGDGPEAEGARMLFATMLPKLHANVLARTGVRLPDMYVRAAPDLAPRSVRVALDDVARSTVQLELDELTELAPDAVRSLTGDDAVAGICPWTGEPASWISSATAERLRDRGVETWDPRGVACAMVVHAIGDGDLARLLEVGQAAELLDGSPENGADAVRRTTLVLRRLAADGVPIHAPGVVRDAVLEAQPEEGTLVLTERARHTLIRDALTGLAEAHEGPVPAVSFSEATESRLARQTRAQRRGDAVVIALDARTRAMLQTALEGVDPPPTGILVVSSPELRAALSPLLRTARLPFRAVDRDELEHVQWEAVAVIELPEEAAPDA